MDDILQFIHLNLLTIAIIFGAVSFIGLVVFIELILRDWK